MVASPLIFSIPRGRSGLRFFPETPPLLWAGDALHAGDFTTDQARWNRAYVGPHSSIPNWTYTRADSQAAYALNLAGVLVPFATGLMRRTDRGLLVEASRTNLALHNRDLTQSAWTKTNCTAAKDQTGADGVANSASSLAATAGNATCLQSITSASANRYGSIWIKRLTGTGNIDVTLDGGTAWTTVTVTAGWTRVGKAQTSVTNPNFGVRIVTSGDAVAIDFGQVESADFPSSPIPTGAATATRAADVAQITTPGVDYPLSLFAEFERQVDSGVFEQLIGLDSGTSTQRAALGVGTTDLPQAYQQTAAGVQAAVTIGSALAVNTRTKLAGRFNLNDVHGARDGALGTADTVAEQPLTPTTIRFGSRNAALDMSWSFVGRWAIWNRLLTNSELQYVTT